MKRALAVLYLSLACVASAQGVGGKAGFGGKSGLGGGPTASASPAWSASDYWWQCNTSTPGTTLTTTILQNCQNPTGALSYTLNGTLTNVYEIAASQGGMVGSITAGGTTYPVGTTTQSMQYNNGTAGPISWDTTSLNSSIAVAKGFITIGPANIVTSGQLYDMVYLADSTPHYCVLQLNNGQGGGNNYAVNMETNPGGVTTHSSYLNVAQGYRYAFALKLDTTAGQCSFGIYDPLNGMAQLGSTITQTGLATGSNVQQLRVGQNELGASTGYFTYYEDLQIDVTNHTFPGVPTGVKTSILGENMVQCNNARNSGTHCDSGNNLSGFATPGQTGSDASGYSVANLLYFADTVSSASLDVGIYSDSSNSPGTLLCHTGTQTVTPVAGTFNSASVSGCGTLAANTQYWVAYVTSSSTWVQGFTSGNCPNVTALSTVFANSAFGSAVLPGTFPANTASGNCYSIAAALTNN